MRKDILLIRKESSFLVNVMTKTLNEAGFYTVSVLPVVKEIDRISNLPDIIMIYLQDDVESFKGIFKYIVKLLGEPHTNRLLFLIGTPLEIDIVYNVIPRNMVTQVFPRPVNMQEVLFKLNYFFDEGETEGNRKHILLVDDDSVMLRTMNNWFSPKYDIFMANSGLNAISLLAQHHVDLILLDYEMPVISGLQVFEMLRSEPATANIPVIFLTAKDDRETVMKVVAARPEKYLLKTMPPEVLLKALDDFFSGKK